VDEAARPPVTVVIVDDHEAVRIGLRAALGAAPDLAVVGEAGRADQAVHVVHSTRPVVAIVDLELPDRDGIELCRDLRSSPDGPACVVLTSHADRASRLAAAVGGAAAFVPKTAATDELADVIRRVAAGASLLDADDALRELRDRAAADPRHRLSPQERRVLALISDGRTNRQIGEALHLTEKTVKNYVSRLLIKLDLRRRTEAAALSARLLERDRIARPWERPGPEEPHAG
jgi:DNA-binding NarL/FixJ family response regulator